MSLQPGQQIELTIEKPAAGGRMIARHEGQIVLVAGAVPGERVRARVHRAERQLAFANVEEPLEASPDRRPAGQDPLCGGCLYAHIAYHAQLRLKREIIQDAFSRLGRIHLSMPSAVAASPERGYRLRARFHVRGERFGFYREGTRELCDPSGTGQLSDPALQAVGLAAAAVREAGRQLATIELAENLDGSQRALHLTAAEAGELSIDDLELARRSGQLTGATTRTAAGAIRSAGIPTVTDSLAALTGGRAVSGILQRHAESFFQANRFLLPQMVGTVLDSVPGAGDVLDLYAGVGLFSIALGASGRQGVTAIEGDRTSGADLQQNAAANGSTVRVVLGSVERSLQQRGRRAATIVVDPPRTGISREAMQAVVDHRADRVIYVSCDPPTMARDARRLLDGGYEVSSLEAFDLFPNTPHVEAVGVFDRR